MGDLTWVLCDSDEDIYIDRFSVGSEDVQGSISEWRVQKRRLRGGLQDGVDVVEIDNGSFRFTLLPSRGMSIWKGWIDDEMIGWKSPIRGPVNPKYVPLSDPGGFGWLEGFDELLVRCGLVSNGAPEFDGAGRLVYPLHGRIGNLPASRVEVRFNPERQEISVIGFVSECRYHHHKLLMKSTVTTHVGQTGLKIHDQVQNLSGNPSSMQMLYHTNIGLPFCEEGAQLIAPVKKLAPWNEQSVQGIGSWDTYEPVGEVYPEQVYLFQLLADEAGQSQVMLKNAKGDAGVNLKFNISQLPCFTQWKNPVAESDGWVTGLEAGTNYPNCRTFEAENGRVLSLAPHEKVDFDYEINLCTNCEQVAHIEQQIDELQSVCDPEILDATMPCWSNQA